MTYEGLWRVTPVRRPRQYPATAPFDTANQPTEGWEVRGDEVRRLGQSGRDHLSDKNGKLALNDGGFARAVDVCDDRGNHVRRTRFGTDNRLVAGVAREEARYDDRRNLLEEAFFDAEHRPVVSGQGYARVVSRYDDRGNRLEQSFYDEREQLRPGWARLVLKHDDRLNRIEESLPTRAGERAGRQGFARAVHLQRLRQLH
jgi:hypothetical protein